MRARSGRPAPLALLAALATACATSAPGRERPAPAPAATPLPSPQLAYGREDPIELTPAERDLVERIGAATGERVQSSPSLSRAARLLAENAARGATNPLGRSQVRAALAAAAAFDPAPVAHLASGPAAALGTSLVARAREHELTHVGVGLVESGETAWAVLLTSRRSVQLEPFPRALPPGSEAPLRGELIALRAPRVVLTLPDGEVEEFATEGDRLFSATLRFEDPGRHTVEVLATGTQGPEVVALLAIDVGRVAPSPADASVPEEDPAALEDAEARVEAAVNELRRRHRLTPLRSDPALRDVARKHSQHMLAAGRVAHVLPDTGDVVARLRRAGIPFERVLENVARGPSGLAAHGAAEDSPAHRGAMLDPGAKTMGCGLARGVLPSGDPAIYLTEVFVEPARPPATAAEVSAATTRIHKLLRTRVAALDRTPPARDPDLDDLAARAARELLRRGSVTLPSGVNRQALELPGRTLAAAEAFVGSDIGDTARARHLADPRFRRIGVGVATGSSAHYGANRLWMVLIFTD